MPGRRRRGHLVGEVVSGEGGVVDLDVDRDVVEQVVALEERMHGRHVEVVLVLGGLEGLRLDQDQPVEPDGVFVLDDHREEPAQLVELPTQVGVEQGLVPFPSAPEHVVLASQPMGGVHAVPHLGGGVGEQLGVGIGGRPGLEARMTEEVGGAPQQVDAGPFHVAGRILDELVQDGAGLLERVALGGHVTIVEAVEGHRELLEELEGRFHLGLGRCDGIVGTEPGTIERPAPEDVGAVPGETVPVRAPRSADGPPSASRRRHGQRRTSGNASGLSDSGPSYAIGPGTLVKNSAIVWPPCRVPGS